MPLSTPILVLVTLYGGNDGLNTVVPYTDSTYQSVRSNIALSASEVLPISDGLGFNSSMPSINALYGQNNVAVVLGTSYPNPSLSHFSSMAIWQAASLSADVTSGWIGRWLDRQPHNPFNAIGIGSTLPPSMVGEKSVASMVDVGGIGLPWGPVASILPRMGVASSSDGALEAAAATSISDLYSTAKALGPLVSTSPTGSSMSEQLSIVSTLINANVPTRVWEVNLSSFDTHGGEVSTQNSLLAEVDAAVGAFMTSINTGSSSQRRHGHDLLRVWPSSEVQRKRRHRPRNVRACLSHWQLCEGRPLRRTTVVECTRRQRELAGGDGLSKHLRRTLAKRLGDAGQRRHSWVEFRTVGALNVPQFWDHQLVRLEGFEPPTLGSVDRCSNPLSYSRVVTGPPS